MMSRIFHRASSQNGEDACGCKAREEMAEYSHSWYQVTNPLSNFVAKSSCFGRIRIV
jgi:hypothetical protein